MIKNTLYAKYISEREGAEILEDESSFITYKINGEECFIKNMYIDPLVRGNGHSRKIIEKLSAVAKSFGCTFLSGTIDLQAPGASRVQAAAISVGFNVVKAHNDILMIKKNLGGTHG